ncbi:Oidioi.mRNA.OKI2018_I69.XSR.g13779.t1.cds [Oikopleura dioica]|uniref:Oidioi.mRNA.OKI2018_I69.XSR.g13779.t1.cds n=1 Tax=Oikopleura dioica TaxID=34765 RepID=A0ABN7SCL3_OIKDI|nr:Oidioi.mRNA.OKI2018_I69.XSR.g13779.t1.cds [Oikopleura dioica]
METALIALFPTLTFCGLIFPAFISFKHESGPKRCRRWLFMIFTVVETYLDVRVWQKFATTGMTLTGYDPTISNLMIFFTFMTFLVQLVKFNLAVIPHIKAYRRVKFGDDKYSVDTTRTVFKIDSFTATLYIFGRVPLSFIVHFYLVKMKVPRAIVPRELTWKLIFHVPIYLYLFWVAYQKVRRSIKATRDCRLKPSAQVGNPNWQWLLGMPYFLAPFYSIMLVAATTSYLQMDEKSQLSLKGCIVGQNPVSQNPLSFRCLRAVDYAILIFFSVFMLSGLVMFIFRIINKQMELLPALNEESYSRGNRARAQKSKRTQPAEESSEKTQAAVVYDAAKETSSKVVTKAVKIAKRIFQENFEIIRKHNEQITKWKLLIIANSEDWQIVQQQYIDLLRRKLPSFEFEFDFFQSPKNSKFNLGDVYMPTMAIPANFLILFPKLDFLKIGFLLSREIGVCAKPMAGSDDVKSWKDMGNFYENENAVDRPDNPKFEFAGSLIECDGPLIFDQNVKTFIDLEIDVRSFNSPTGFSDAARKKYWPREFILKEVPKIPFHQFHSPSEPIRFTHIPNDACQKIVFPVFVKSTVTKVGLRNLIRENFKLWNIDSGKLFFIFGETTQSSREALENEIQKYDDIIITSYEDTYDNLPYKTFGAYKFIEEYCNLASWIIIHDDDTFIKYERQYEIFKRSNFFPKEHLQCMYGYFTEEAPLRWSKYGVGFREYPFGYYYPKFCHGPCMSLSKAAASKIYHQAMITNWNGIILEDVLFSGIIRELANVTSMDIERGSCEHISSRLPSKEAAFQKLLDASRRKAGVSKQPSPG